MKQTIYISGKITGCADLNRPKFTAAEVWVLHNGGIPVNPHKLPDNHDKSWFSYMRECVAALARVDQVVCLDDWNRSSGAIREVIIAKWLQIPVYTAFSMHPVRVSAITVLKLLLKRI